MELSVFVVSDSGIVRSRNEDMAAVGRQLFRNQSDGWTESFPEAPRSFVAGVADGLGGSAAGDVASKLPLERFVAAVNELESGLSPRSVMDSLSAVAMELHDEIGRQGMLHSERRGMATTLSSFVWYQGRTYLVHAGDSRLYLFRRGALTQLTRDHTLREFSGNPRIPGNILVNCIGVERDFFSEVRALEDVGRPGDVLLACTDGLTDTVPPRDISTVLERRLGDGPTATSLRAVGNELLSRANAAGAHDNVTFVLITLA